MVQCQMLSRSTGCYRKPGVAGGFYPPLRFRLMGRSVGADRIRPNVMGLSRSLNGAMSDVAPFNRDIPLSGGAGDTSRYPKGQSVFCPLGCLPCHNHGAASCGGCSPAWGNQAGEREIYALVTGVVPIVPSNTRLTVYSSAAKLALVQLASSPSK